LLCGKLPNKRHEERFKVEVCAAALFIFYNNFQDLFQ
jgi:hypothetical protein